MIQTNFLIKQKQAHRLRKLTFDFFFFVKVGGKEDIKRLGLTYSLLIIRQIIQNNEIAQESLLNTERTNIGKEPERE